MMPEEMKFDFEGQCFECGYYSSETNRDNICRNCAEANQSRDEQPSTEEARECQ